MSVTPSGGGDSDAKERVFSSSTQTRVPGGSHGVTVVRCSVKKSRLKSQGNLDLDSKTNKGVSKRVNK